MSDILESCAKDALQTMLDIGFDDALVSAEAVLQDELNIAHNSASLLRSTEQHSLALTGIVGGRKASTELTDLSADNVRRQAQQLFADADSAPVDTANAVSENQVAHIECGPLQPDAELMATRAAELLQYREQHAAGFSIEEATVSHTLVDSHILSSRGTRLTGRRGWYGINALGTARDGEASSSMNYTGGATHSLSDQPVDALFGIGEMMQESLAQTHPQQLPGKFNGDVVLTPHATSDLLYWLLGQLSDVQLIAGSSLFRNRVGDAIASELLTIRSRFDAPGVPGISADAFCTPAMVLLDRGRLNCLLPSQYGSLKTGIAHVPTSFGWEMDAGSSPRETLHQGIERGAIVGRLSMGSPAPNGDFSGVIKNSFLIENGEQGPALAEVMITGNIARMLTAISAISTERLDTGATALPWLRIPGLSFS